MSHIQCQYNSYPAKKNGYNTKVTLRVTVSSCMDGWEMTIQLPLKSGVRVMSVKGGQLIGSETIQNGSIVIRDRILPLDPHESFSVSFIVKTGQSNPRLFPATFNLTLPPPRMVDGMCTGEKVPDPSTQYRVIDTNWEYGLTLLFRTRYSRVSSCKLSFNVPVTVKAVHHAEYIGRLDKYNYLLGLITQESLEAVIEYRKEGLNTTSGHGFANVTCLLCVKSNNGTFEISTLHPDGDCDMSGKTGFPSHPPLTSPSSRSSPTSSLPDKKATDPQKIDFNETTGVHQHPEYSEPSNSPTVDNHPPTHGHSPDDHPHTQLTSAAVSAKDKSSSSSSVLIGVAVGCSIGLLVLLVVVVAMFISRRWSRSAAITQYGLQTRGQAHGSNVYTRPTISSNGHRSFTSPAFLEPPPGPQTSDEFMKDGGGRYKPEYEELEVYLPKEYDNFKDREKVEYYDGVPSRYEPLLPGQMIDVPQAQSNRCQVPLTPTASLGHYSIPRPSTTDSIIESGDEDMPEEDPYMKMQGPDTYIKMNNPSLKRTQQDLNEQDQVEKNEPENQAVGNQDEQDDQGIEDEPRTQDEHEDKQDA